MEQVSLYRKYRPHNFANLVGQDHIKTTLINALKTDHVAHAYLFTGPRGTGKTSSARLVARALNCTNLADDYEPCQTCDFCKDISDGRLIDLIEIDAASNRGIDEVRDLKEKINFAPSHAKYKVYIIDEVHMMTKEAFNALLKTLEEPPSHVYFILATTEVHKIPETIISRCQRFDFRRISQDDVSKRLQFIAKEEKIEVDPAALKIISKCVDGGLRDAIGLLEQLNFDGKVTLKKVQEVLGVSSLSLLEKMLSSLMQNNTEEALKVVHELHIQGSDLKQFMHEFVDILREKMLSSVSNGKLGETRRLIEMIDVFLDAQSRLYTSIPQLALEIAIIRISSDLESANPAKAVKQAAAAVPVAVAPTPVAPVAAAPTPVTPAPTTAAAPVTEKALSLTLETLKDKWPRITERIKTPSLRMSLKSTVPVKIDGHDVSLQFNTNFHHNNVMKNDHRVELEKLIKGFFDVNIKVLGIIKEVELKPLVEDEAPMPVPPPIDGPMVDQALEIFGGELME